MKQRYGRPQYFDYAVEYGMVLRGRELSIQDVWELCNRTIELNRLYKFKYGARCPVAWELSLLEQKLGHKFDWKNLRGEDKDGVRKKDRQMTLPGLKVRNHGKR